MQTNFYSCKETGGGWKHKNSICYKLLEEKLNENVTHTQTKKKVNETNNYQIWKLRQSDDNIFVYFVNSVERKERERETKTETVMVW